MFKITSSICLVLACSVANASELNKDRPDGHAPIGVMRDHTHEKGEFMLSYRYEFMKMKRISKNNHEASTADILQDYSMTPVDMDMRMHMVGAMYGVTEDLTLMAMGSFIDKDMSMLNGSGKYSEMESMGFGDTKISAMYQAFNSGDNRLQYNLGFSIPTGNIKEHSKTGSTLPYQMQIGSGSYEFLPGLSYNGYNNSYSYGAQVNGVFRLNTNNSGYKMGDSYNFTTWVAKKLDNALSISSRLDYTINESIKGKDTNISQMMINMSPTNNSTFSGSKKLDLFVGSNFIIPSTALKGNRIAFEFGFPLYQSMKGIQLQSDYKLILGWQKSF